jgi:hypothetical protein
VIEKSFDFWYAAHQHLTFYPKKRHPIFKQAKADTQQKCWSSAVAIFNRARPMQAG